MKKSCLKCGYVFDGTTQDGKQVKACQLTMSAVGPSSACDNYAEKACYCYCCSKPIPYRGALAIKTKDDSYALICSQCYSIYGKCNSCGRMNFCEFETNMSSLPKYVIKTEQHGNMTQRIQIKNPDRVNATCRMDCKCWNDSLQECMKTFSEGCSLWESGF